MEDLTYDDITEPVDCVVEWMGYALFFEHASSVVDAATIRGRGLVLPNVAVVRVALLSDQDSYDGAVTFWKDVYGFDFSALIPQTKRDWSSDPPVTTVDHLAGGAGGGLRGLRVCAPRRSLRDDGGGGATRRRSGRDGAWDGAVVRRGFLRTRGAVHVTDGDQDALVPDRRCSFSVRPAREIPDGGRRGGSGGARAGERSGRKETAQRVLRLRRGGCGRGEGDGSGR